VTPPDVSADRPIQEARTGVLATRSADKPQIKAFFDAATCTVSYVVSDPHTKVCAIIDSVLDFDAASGRIATVSAERILNYIRDEALSVEWLLETHVHADHLSAAPYIRSKVGGRLGIARHILKVLTAFGKLFNEGAACTEESAGFDQLFDDGDTLSIGRMQVVALGLCGHTPADMAYVVKDAAFVGDTLFMPDFGTARTDFPGGDAHELFRSIQRLLSLPDETRLFLCHDYKAPGRDEFAWETTVAAQRAGNIHLGEGITEDAFAAMRQSRDLTLPMPKLLLPALQVNIRGGQLPDAEDNGIRYLKIPLDQI
jgi:glyoxylase-like metal-dependent hydrolase (beta-lactamase superfamily II)